MRNLQRFGIVITHAGASDGMVDVPWLEKAYRIDASDWIVVSEEGWRAVAEGDPLIWEALERKLLIGFYVSQPELIAVIGHPAGRHGSAADNDGRDEVGRIVRHIRSLLLPAAVLGFWTDAGGWLEDIVEPDEPDEDLGEVPAFLREGEPAGRWQE